MAESRTAVKRSGLGTTMRRDAWWLELLPVVVILGGFGVYATWRAFEGAYYEWGPYLSPFYSPLIQPHWWPFSPALLILGGPLGFRATCYYYRKAYYRAFFLDPPGCAVGEGKRNYKGETKFPFILQNVHRYFLYLAVLFLFFLWKDAIQAFLFDGKFGMGVGKPDFGWIGGFLRAAGGFWRDSRCEDLLSERFETHEHDVLVIGAGGAGLRAAIEALGQGASVGVVSKSLLGKAHTVMAEGGIAAAMANVDSADGWKPHFRDTMRGGKMLNNWRMAQLHAQEAPERVMELEQWGALFDRTDDGRILQRAFGGHTFRRLCHVGDRTGLEMIRTLQDRGVHMGFDVYMECTIVRLLTDGGRCAGALAYWRETGRFVLFKAKSIVMATGGIGMAWPPGVQGILVTEAVRGEGGILRNKNGERFMERYDPKRMELSTRDVVARSIYTEVKEGRGTEHGGAYLDISHKPAEYVKKKLPSMYHQFKELADVDITKGPMEVGPTCHYMMGGIRVDAETAQSTVPGLFAAGEAAAGLHGSNRLGGNSLSDLLVFGRRAGLAAAEHAKRASASSFDNSQIEPAEKELLAPFSNSGTESPYAVHRDLQEVMQNLVGIYRTKEDLEKAHVELEKLRVRAAKASVEGSRLFNPGWHLSYDLKAMLIVSEAVTHSALARTESRGAHSRIDYPNLDSVWEKKHNIIVRETGAMKRRESPIEAMPEELKQTLAEDKS